MYHIDPEDDLEDIVGREPREQVCLDQLVESCDFFDEDILGGHESLSPKTDGVLHFLKAFLQVAESRPSSGRRSKQGPDLVPHSVHGVHVALTSSGSRTAGTSGSSCISFFPQRP